MGTPKSNEKGHGINSSNIEARVEDDNLIGNRRRFDAVRGSMWKLISSFLCSILSALSHAQPQKH